jgi:hypothetical protein
MSKIKNRWKNNPELMSIINKISDKLEKGESVKKLTGDFISKAQELGMPKKVAECCGFSVVEGVGTICSECQEILDDMN